MHGIVAVSRKRPASCLALRLRTLAVGILLIAGGPAQACQVVPRATIPLARAGTAILVPVTVNGTVADFLLDTGAERSVIGLQAADRLHVARDEWVSTDIQGAGGRDRRRLGRPASLMLGGLALRRHTVAADNSVVIGPIPEAVEGKPVAGLLGQDFLSPFDLDLDLPAGTLTLVDVTACRGRFLPWRMPYQAVAAWRPVRNILAVPISVGDARIEALLDTGALQSVITLPGMIQLGLAAGGADRVGGFGPNSLAARIQTFPSVQVGGLGPAPMAMMVAPVRTLRSIGALLGADWLAGRHVWISWATDQVFVESTAPTATAPP